MILAGFFDGLLRLHFISTTLTPFPNLTSPIPPSSSRTVTLTRFKYFIDRIFRQQIKGPEKNSLGLRNRDWWCFKAQMAAYGSTPFFITIRLFRRLMKQRRWKLMIQIQTFVTRISPKFSINGLQNFDRENVASVVTAADKGGATHVDIACDPDLVRLAIGLTSLPVCVSSVDPAAFSAAVEAGALMVEIGNYDSFYEAGVIFSPEQILKLTKETRSNLPSITLSVTVPHTLSLPDQVKLAEMLEKEGVDVIQTEGGKCSAPSKSGVLGLIEKATPTLAAAYSISKAVKIPVMCSSGLSAVTAPMAITAGAAGVGVGSAVNKLNDVIAMVAEVRSIAESLKMAAADQQITHTDRSFMM